MTHRATFDPFNPTHRRALLAELAAYAPAKPVAEPAGAPPEPAHPANAARDLDALARCLPALLGGAMPIVRIPGGQSAGSPAEHVQPYLAGARRALRRLAWLRAQEIGYGHVLVLLSAYVLRGEDQRPEGWEVALRTLLLPGALRPTKGPELRAGAILGARMLAASVEAYSAAREADSDGRWLEIDLDVITRRMAEARAQRAPVEPAPPSCRPLRVTEGGCCSVDDPNECAWPRVRRCAQPESPTLALLRAAAA